jgi:hypothetical protein
VARLLTEPDLRRTVTDAAFDLFDARFRSELVEEAVARLATEVAESE